MLTNLNNRKLQIRHSDAKILTVFVVELAISVFRATDGAEPEESRSSQNHDLSIEPYLLKGKKWHSLKALWGY